MCSEHKILDVDLDELQRILSVIDEILASLEWETSWNEGARDLADYWAGVGFVACQRYLVAMTSRAGVEKKQALDAGPRLHGGNTVVSIINAAANAWKHETEWLNEFQYARKKGNEELKNKRRDQALDSLDSALGEYDWDYKLANTLYALCGEIAFSRLISRLTEWNDALFADQQA